MTKEELKVMIDETINSNGVRSITGKALNLALTEIVDAMGTTSDGGDEGLKRNDVNFFDYDGTLLYAYTWEEAKALTELPPLPVHDGLEVREWNYTLEDIKAQEVLCFADSIGEVVGYVGDVVINGVSYKAYSFDGSLNRIYILTQEPQVGDSLTGAEYDSDSGEYTLYNGVDEVTEIFNIIGKADIGACVYDNGEQVQVPGVYIFERGINENDAYEHMINVIVWLVSIPNTMSRLYNGFMDNSVALNEIKIPYSVNIVDTGYGNAFQNSRTESAIWWNGVNRHFAVSINYGMPIQISNQYISASISSSNATRYILGNSIREIDYVST